MGESKRNTADEPETEPDRSGSLSFEGALEQLEQTVARLEEGEMPLEEALELFESGVKLSRRCNETLGAAERRIEILVADRSDTAAAEASAFPQTRDFEDDFEDEDEEEFED
jgi:exodeoxyribonuclease VII small subunit